MLHPRTHARLALRRATAPISHDATFVAIAALVVYGDLVTKWLAETLWSGETYDRKRPTFEGRALRFIPVAWPY